LLLRIEPGRLGFRPRRTYLNGMRKPEKAKPVRLVKDDGRIHLAAPRARSSYTSMSAIPPRTTLCGKAAAGGVLAGLPTAQPEDRRCPTCYAAVDAYGYPREMA
jgi:hypothetical protein